MTDDLGIPPAELPRADSPGAPGGVTPAVAADIEADIAGEPRSRARDLTPPGTDREEWWQRSAFKMLCGGIALVWLPILHAWIAASPIDRLALADATSDSINAILLWAGVTTIDKGGLRKK